MATVYQGFDQNLHRAVAIKVLSATLAADPSYVDRFRQEPRLIASLRHPHIAHIYAFGEHTGAPYMVQELLQGPTLEQRLKDLAAQGERMPQPEVLATITQLASALDAAHAIGVIHRDVKPSNALYNAQGQIVLTDFGIARSAADASRTATAVGVVMGTPGYVAPEQAISSASLTPACDIYALGVVLFELLLGTIASLEDGQRLVRQIMTHFDEQRAINPALLIPMDASGVDPRLRLYPATFRNPLPELLTRLDRCNALVVRLKQQPDPATLAIFEQERSALFADLYNFGAALQALKQVTMRGEGFTTAALRLLGHLPKSMQHLLDLIPQKFGVLNEILKGREVFSNVGQVVATSMLTRFASARDDGETKLLVWGVMSDAKGRLVVTLRDFRPHVAPLIACGRADLAEALAQDYLDDYAAGVNALIRRIQRVLAYV
jgi:serine/threonine protein kinase